MTVTSPETPLVVTSLLSSPLNAMCQTRAAHQNVGQDLKCFGINNCDMIGRTKCNKGKLAVSGQFDADRLDFIAVNTFDLES